MSFSNTDQSLSQNHFVKFSIYWEDDGKLRNNIIMREFFKSDISYLLNINCNLYDIFVHKIKKAEFNAEYEHLEKDSFDKNGELIRVHDAHEAVKKVISRYSTELNNVISTLSKFLLQAQ